VQAHRREAQRLRHQGNTEEAVREYGRALAINPNDVDALTERGDTRRAKGDTAGALADYQRAIEIDPCRAPAHSRAAESLYAQQEWDRAIQHLTRAIEINDRNAHYYAWRAAAQLAQREFKRALDDYDQAHQIDPVSVSIINNFAWFLATCPDVEYRDGKRALRLAHDLVARQRTAPYLDTLAAAYAELGKFREAIKMQEEAIALAEKDGPEDLLPQFRERLGRYRKREAWRP